LQEEYYWRQAICLIAGIDEAGMGALAGPVVAAAVIFDSSGTTNRKRGEKNLRAGLRRDGILIQDSKQLTMQQREAAAVWIKKNARAWALGEASVEEITKLNIRGASHLAMRRAVDALVIRPELLFVDGTPAQPHDSIPAVNFIGGDALCVSIAAASILAKVHRDQIMTVLDKQFPVYGLASHKGYASAAHKAALARYGPCQCHRPTYAPVAQALADRTF
jgi:ribonuclease HII